MKKYQIDAILGSIDQITKISDEAEIIDRYIVAQRYLNDLLAEKMNEVRGNKTATGTQGFKFDTIDNHTISIPVEEVYFEAIGKYGPEKQKTVAMEEMAELIQAISKEIRGCGDYLNIAEEIADVRIMLEQLEIIYNNKFKTEQFYSQKILRLKARLENDL